ncbi:PhzF family phenazine biosynthesis protein [Vibrio ostreicida]|uniref:PhzF family phenazine biosynthesis protein n=1 Tax=Vibrio ostreicida TaxID=526588 RepID=UPI0015C3DF1A|nr:PhzF family phenazine biosynthesis protein [Vibrio ostreicida]
MPIQIEVFLVNAFTANGTGGNPAGVVFDAESLSEQQKLDIAQAVGYSETAFVSWDGRAEFEVSFFTVTEEVDFCGHATLAVFATLYETGQINAGEYWQKTKAGRLSVVIEPTGQVIMGQALPKKLAGFSGRDVAPLLGIDDSVIASTGLPVEVISTGLADVIIPVQKGYLDKLKPNHTAISAFCEAHQVVGFHVFELATAETSVSARCRNFAPLFGIDEESATGSSNGALACYLTEHCPSDEPSHYLFEQGKAMNATSMISASVSTQKDQVVSVRVGGFARSIGRLTVDLSPTA